MEFISSQSDSIEIIVLRALLLSVSTWSWRSRLKSLIKRRDIAANCHPQALCRLQRNKIAHAVSKDVNRSAVLQGRVYIARQLSGSVPSTLFKVKIAELLLDEPQSIRAQCD